MFYICRQLILLNFDEIFLNCFLFYLLSYINILLKKAENRLDKNISKFGITGLVIRVHDKVARVENLMKKENYANAVGDETILDTLMDIIGYSIIAYMWLNNTFMYELEGKNEQTIA